jgi:PDZ domain
VKRPGQTLGLYIREGNGGERNEGVFISRIALESPVYHSGCLHVSDEILAVNLVDVTRISLDDVVIIMSIPRRLVLTTRRRRGMTTGPGGPGTSSGIGVSFFLVLLFAIYWSFNLYCVVKTDLWNENQNITA